jgi:hypothetical protein
MVGGDRTVLYYTGAMLCVAKATAYREYYIFALLQRSMGELDILVVR